MLATDPNWVEQVTAVATALGAIGLLSAIGAVVFASQQVREARETRQAQLAALEELGAFHLGLIETLLGHRLVERWELWEPSIAMMGEDPYPMFRSLAAKMRRAIGPSSSVSG
jgi:hypothetical protein